MNEARTGDPQDADIAAPIRGERARQDLAHTFVELADSMVADFDLVEFLHVLATRTVDLLTADAAGLMLADQRGYLFCLAATREDSHLIELFELQNSDGPCLDSFHSGQQVVNVDIVDAERRWPLFAAEIARAGFQSVHALPLRLRGRVIGAMNLFCVNHLHLSAEDIEIGQALADVATIGLLSQLGDRHEEVIVETLQEAVNGRIAIEQAKGILAHTLTIDMDRGLHLIRNYARSHGEKIITVANGIVDGSVLAQRVQDAPAAQIGSPST